MGFAIEKADDMETSAPWCKELGQDELLWNESVFEYWSPASGSEYTDAMCRFLAEQALRSEVWKGVPGITAYISEEGTHDPMEPETKKARRERENQDAIGGMKSPHISIARLPGWTSAGSRIRQVLEPLVENQWQEVRTTLEGMGKENAVDLPESLVQAAQVGLEREFNVEHRKCEPRRIHDGLMAAITAAAGDPDDVLAGWVAGETPLESSRRYQHGGFSRWLTRRMASLRCKKPPTLLLGRSSKGTIPLPKNTRIEWRWN